METDKGAVFGGEKMAILDLFLQPLSTEHKTLQGLAGEIDEPLLGIGRNIDGFHQVSPKGPPTRGLRRAEVKPGWCDPFPGTNRRLFRVLLEPGGCLCR